MTNERNKGQTIVCSWDSYGILYEESKPSGRDTENSDMGETTSFKDLPRYISRYLAAKE